MFVSTSKICARLSLCLRVCARVCVCVCSKNRMCSCVPLIMVMCAAHQLLCYLKPNANLDTKQCKEIQSKTRLNFI